MKYFKYIFNLVLVIALGSSLVACQSSSVKRMDASEQEELTGKWNANDSRLVSKEMINSMLDNRWLQKHLKKYKKEPTIIIGNIKNKSHEIINVSTFVADIERVMINSGEVYFVSSRDERGEIRDERKDQELHSSRETRKAMGKEAGADYMLTGTISSFVEQVDGTKNIQYQIDMSLTSMIDNRKVWGGSKKHAKTISRSSLGF